MEEAEHQLSRAYCLPAHIADFELQSSKSCEPIPYNNTFSIDIHIIDSIFSNEHWLMQYVMGLLFLVLVK